eukprot:CAMPEP_0174271034 /NCGR_PEP_ID=MMETSP0439-20130205/46563_1 /TAXON_ID=0 /ORGANISM="Stereomyxa ramosa, Strain Chinc5" /LENGTH=544 /DNA_ID=CAMNT_0015360771 /DNA_START=10 /DNA_END=1644 /DNA_ORIENTATION=-
MSASTSLHTLLKEGTKNFSGTEAAVLRNIEACKQASFIVRTSLGPLGMNKMIINKNEKLYVTNDAATIVRELDVIHPAAKLLVMAVQMQEQECGDATNLVLALSGELLRAAESLIRMGLHPSEIITGYSKAGDTVLEELEALTCHTVTDLRDINEVAFALKTSIGAKQFGNEEALAPVIAKACVQILPENPIAFNVDNVRVTKILGGGVLDTTVVKGFVLTRDAAGSIKHVTSAKVGVFASGLDIAKTETKSTVALKTAKELLEYSKGEEEEIEKAIKAISEAGTKVIVSGGQIGELALHFIERYGMMVVKMDSKFNLRRLCKATGATPLVRLGAPTPDELGFCDVVSVEEIGSHKVCVFRQNAEASGISTIIVRASTQNILDDVERAIDDGVNVFKGMTKDARFLPGGGATEIELAKRLQSIAESTPGLDQYAIQKYAEALEIVPRILAENSGHLATDCISKLYAAHHSAKEEDTNPANYGVDVSNGDVIDVLSAGILDLQINKHSAIKLATDAATTVLRVDQIIMARPAGGPKPPQMGARDA